MGNNLCKICSQPLDLPSFWCQNKAHPQLNTREHTKEEAERYERFIDDFFGEPKALIDKSELAALRARVKELEAELAKYRDQFGCLACGEIHEGDCCPPHEVRTTGKSWYSTTQAINRYNAMKAELKRLGKFVK